MTATDEDFQAGRLMGARPDGSAIDCPFLPGPDTARRRRWLEGFGSVRPGVSTQKSDPPPKEQQSPHAA